MKIEIPLSNEEYGEFKELLYVCSDCGLPLIDASIAERVLKILEDEEE